MRTNKILFLVLLCLFEVSLLVKTIKAQQPYSVPTTIANPYYTAYSRVDTGFFNRPNTISPTVATALSASQSGTAVLLTIGSGIIITLPAPVSGLYFDVYWSTSTTAGSMKVITDAGTTFIAGAPVITSSLSAGSAFSFACNGTSHIATLSNGAATGGLIGSWLRFFALSPTLWGVTGELIGSGGALTPCSTT